MLSKYRLQIFILYSKIQIQELHKNIIFYVYIQDGAITLSTLNITAIFRNMKIL